MTKGMTKREMTKRAKACLSCAKALRRTRYLVRYNFKMSNPDGSGSNRRFETDIQFSKNDSVRS
jgi:hypothetical protein